MQDVHSSGPIRKAGLNPWVCAGINQFAWPGLGSILGGRAVGFVQAALMLVGFILFVGFMLLYFKNMYAWALDPQGSERQLYEGYRPYAWLWITGLGACVLSWAWSLATSITLIRSAPPTAPPTPLPTLEKPAGQR